VGDAELKVLFIGNSLTYWNDLPAMVQTVAEAAGHTLAYSMFASGGTSLEDHWYGGVEAAIRSVSADVVVLQQGPSSLPANQLHLRTWADTLARVIRDTGGEPALFMVWPEDTRMEAFDAVHQAYRDAAKAVGGLFIPAGQAWRYAWAAAPGLPLYGGDGFHPSTLGSAVAAITIFRVLFSEPVTDLPSRLVPVSAGLPIIDLGANAGVVFKAVEEAISAEVGGVGP
jgi:hypothetical protein